MTESMFQAKLKKEIKRRLPGAIVLKNDPTNMQGIPDLLILYGPKWAALEVKKSKTAKHRPNQDYRVKKMNDMSYAAFVYPENKKEILDEMEQSLLFNRRTRISRSVSV